MSLLTIISLIFMVLKLTNYIDWSWWIVLSPFIIHAVLWLSINLWWESKTPVQKARWKMEMGIK